MEIKMKKNELNVKKYRSRGKRKYILLLAAMLLLGGCGQAADEASAGSAPEESRAAETAEIPAVEEIADEDHGNGPEAAGEELSVQEIYDLIAGTVTLISPVIMQDSFIENYYNIEPGLLEEYVFSMSEEATSAETVVIMKLKDKTDAGTISAALQLIIEEKSGEMENYLPQQYDIVKKSAVKTEGSYVYLVISEQADAIEQIIEAQL